MRLAVTEPGQAEIFHALQGEGLSLGRPSVFVRLSQCNLQCVWCDTPYTWNFIGTDFAHRDDVPGKPAKYDRTAESVDLSPAEVVEQILQYPAQRVTFTGGEPLLQQRELGEVCALLKANTPGYHLELETNATIAPTGPMLKLIDQFNISPKLAHSGNNEAVRRRADVLRAYGSDPRAVLKIVVSDPSDMDEVETLIAISGIARDRVYLMPEGIAPDVLAERTRWLAPLCLEKQLNFTGRLHIDLYGDTRGT
jgi:7-carboxy-7-deazaguanine synthase